jgi:hypothetical protein
MLVGSRNKPGGIWENVLSTMWLAEQGKRPQWTVTD